MKPFKVTQAGKRWQLRAFGEFGKPFEEGIGGMHSLQPSLKQTALKLCALHIWSCQAGPGAANRRAGRSA